MFHDIFGKIDPGMCRLSMNGGVAVKTSTGFKTYNLKTGRLTNCDQFVFNIGEEMFFLVPTNRVRKGDIILAAGKPKCVISTEKDMITAINYEDSTVEHILPEHHMFLGNTYFYGKIVSLLGNRANEGKKGPGKILKYMMLREMLGKQSGTAGGGANTMNNLLPFFLMGNTGNIFDNMFDFEEDEETDAETDED
ncbi:MAG: hypothetical protein IJH71_09580 [Eubacterium sp.]|nr:hypothetical protein [Eubacterium sp.]